MPLDALSHYNEFLSGKRVALVGPASTIIGSLQREGIESCDWVVRLNHQWPVPPEHAADLGTRMDVLFHCCNADFAIQRLFTDDFSKTRLVCYEKGLDTYFLIQECRKRQIPSLDVTPTYWELQSQLKSWPSTGLVALYRLLQSPLHSLFVTGFTFFQTGYYPGYLGRTERPYVRHDFSKELCFFRERLASDPRLILGPERDLLMGAEHALRDLSAVREKPLSNAREVDAST